MDAKAEGRERCRCACGATWTAGDFAKLRAIGVWPTDVGVLELRVCSCGSTISAPFSHKSTTLTVTARGSAAPPPALFPPDSPRSTLLQVEPNRFQVRCACMRTSPILAGTRALAERLIESLDWQLCGDEWMCPICADRMRDTRDREESGVRELPMAAAGARKR